MIYRLTLMLIAGTVVLAACDGGSKSGIASLGRGFAKAFYQDRNDEPLDASTIALNLTPTIEPFNP